MGHAQIIGITDPLKDFTTVRSTDIVNYFNKVKKQGAMVQINHPFAPDYPWKINFDQFPYDTVELFHAGWDIEETKCTDWWQGQLKSGKKVVVTAGSDSHTNGADRFPFNCVYSVSRDSKGILSAIKDGHLYLSVSAKGPDINLTSGKAIMGDTVPYQKDAKICIFVTSLNAGDEIQVITDKGIELKEQTDGNQYYKQIPLERRMFYRVEVSRNDKVTSLSNPIYVKSE